MSRTQRFIVGQEVVVAEHSPLDMVGRKLVVCHIYPDRIEHPLTGGAPYTARYKLIDAEEARENRVSRFTDLWDWMLEPVGSAELKPPDDLAQQATD